MEMNNSKLNFEAVTAQINIAEYNQLFNRKGDDLDLPCYGFSLGAWNFLLPQGAFAELVSKPNYTSVPNAPEHFLGLANVRGNVMPYYSFAGFFPDVPDVRAHKQDYALLLSDAINGILVEIDGKPAPIQTVGFKFTDTNYIRLPNSIKAFVAGSYANESESHLMLDVSKLVEFLTSVSFPSYE
jgi:chemotaxis signal transduction protein